MANLAILQDAIDAGFEVVASGGELIVRGPKNMLDILQSLKAHKDDIINKLAADSGESAVYEPSLIKHVSIAPGELSTASTSTQVSIQAKDGGFRRQGKSAIEDNQPTLPKERWRKSDERGLGRCRKCGGPVRWVEVLEDTRGASFVWKTVPDKKTGKMKRRRRMMAVDPDGYPHRGTFGINNECGGPFSGRVVYSYDAEENQKLKEVGAWINF